MKTTLKFRSWMVNYKPPPIFESKVLLEHNKPCLFFCVYSLAGFRLQLKSWVAHIDLWPKSLEYYYLVLDRKSLPTSAHTDTARVLEQMLAWITQKCSEIWNRSFFLFSPWGPAFSPWAGISLASVQLAFLVILVVLFWRGLGRNKDEGVGWWGDGAGRWVGIGHSGPPGYYALLLRSPSCGGLVNDADRVIPVASHPGHLRRVISM